MPYHFILKQIDLYCEEEEKKSINLQYKEATQSDIDATF